MQASSERPLLDSGMPVAGVSPLTPSRRRIAVRFGMGMSSKVASDVRERLAAAREFTGKLERNRTELIRQMRQAVSKMKSVRERLLSGRGGDGGRHGADPAARLVRRYHLTARELEVALLLSRGASNAEIATALRISEHTARHHTRHVLLKLGLHSRARAAAVLARHLGKAAPPIS